MSRMDNQSLVKLFISGNATNKDQSHSGNLWVSTDNSRLMNYATCLAERHPDYGIIINRTSYSVTTSKIQGYISSALWQRFDGEWITENTIEVDNVRQSTSSLVQAAKDKIEWAKGLCDIKVINYFDVWGNKKDGWEINNLCTEDEMSFELHEDDFYNHKVILQKLKDVGFLKSTTRINMVIFEDLFDFGVEVYQKKDQRPLCRIEFVKEGVQA